MRWILIVAAIACLVPLGAAQAEEGAKTYDLHTWSAVWKVGDTATVQEDDSFVGTFDGTEPDPQTGKEKSQAIEHESRTISTRIIRCLEADEQGRATKLLAYVPDWTETVAGKVDGQAQPSTPDTSLKGLHVEVTVTGGVHGYRILTQDAKPSPGGIAWLEKIFGSRQKGRWVLDLDLLGRPEGPVRVGDSWKGDPSKLGLPFPIDAQTSTQKVTLGAVEAGTMRLPIQLRVRLTGWPLRGGVMAPFTDGGVFEMAGSLAHSLAQHTFEAAGSFSGELKGTAAIKGVAKVEIQLRQSSEIKARTGGDMPAVKTK